MDFETIVPFLNSFSGELVLPARQNGFLALGNFSGSVYNGLLPWHEVAQVNFIKRYRTESRPRLRLSLFVLFAIIVAAFYLLADDAFARDGQNTQGLTVLFGALLAGMFSILFPENIGYRLFIITIPMAAKLFLNAMKATMAG